MIELRDVYYRYPKAEKDILCGFSVKFEKGETVAVTGTNGCGKTTMTKLIAGMLRPARGSVIIDGEDTSAMDLFDIGRRVGYIFQNPVCQLFCPTVREEIAYGLENLGLAAEEINEKVKWWTEFFRIEHHLEDYPGTLSHGEKQRVALAAVLAMGTDYLVLDEPTTGLDIRGRDELAELLCRIRKERGTGTVIVTHERSFLEKTADRELVMR